MFHVCVWGQPGLYKRCYITQTHTSWHNQKIVKINLWPTWVKALMWHRKKWLLWTPFNKELPNWDYLQLLLLLTTRKYANIPSYRQEPIERTWRQFTFQCVSLLLRTFVGFWETVFISACFLESLWADHPGLRALLVALNFSAQTIAKLMFYCNHRFSVSSSGTRRTGQPLKGMKGKASGRAGCDTLQDYCTLSCSCQLSWLHQML